MARLVISGPEGEREVPLGERLTIGRVEGVDLVLDDKGISRRHCEFEKRGDAWLVRDLGSSNGTLVNGEKTAADHRLSDGDRVRLGGLTLTFHERDADCVLRFTAGEHSGREVPLAGPRTTLGRRSENALAFTDVKVSGVHLEVVREGDGFVLRDLGSTNGTLLDGKKVTTDVALSHGDRVKLGANEFVFVDLRRGALPAADSGAGEAAASGPSRAAALPEMSSKAGALLGLAGVVIVVGAAAAWYFRGELFGGDAAAGPVKQAPAAPVGTLLGADWSFEETAAVDELWTPELGEGFSARRGEAPSGSYVLVGVASEGHVVAARRRALPVAGGAALTCSGQLEAGDGVLGAVTLRFRSAEGDAVAREWSVVVAQRRAAGFESFQQVVIAPSWARSLECVVTARGEGRVALDDLALAPGGPAREGVALGDMQLRARGPSAWYVDHRASLVELFAPTGSGTVAPAEEGQAPQRVALPPGALEARASAERATFSLEPGSGVLAAAAFAFDVAPEMAQLGVTVRTATTTERRFGAFTLEGVAAMWLGGAAERLEIAFDPPARVAAGAQGDALRFEIAADAPRRATLRAGFDTERKEANDLYARAQEEWRAGRAGSALAKLREIRERLPHDDKSSELARALEAEIVPKLEAELESVEAEAVAAEFLASLDHYRRVLARADRLLAQAAGLDAARTFAERVEQLRATADAMERERREEEARRLLALARAYSAQEEPAVPRPLTAAELLAELQRSYADTAAAREARGEPGVERTGDGEGR